jgi:hypothetical protein
MNILFDLLHPADVNLFRNSVFSLSREGYNIFLSYRKRGSLEAIARSEFPGYIITPLGEHRGSIVGKIISLIYREIISYRYLRENKISLVVCQGIACGLACKMLGVKILHCDDDSEYRLTYLLGKWFSDIDLVPDFMPVNGRNIYKYKGYKELAYLHPDYFTPDPLALNEFGIEQGNYIFIREVSNISTNYYKREVLIHSIIDYLDSRCFKVVLSIEDKKLARDFSNQCIVLAEPVKNIYSLIFYSRFVISSGDTMAREACLLGLPCIYTGGREMNANRFLIDLQIMLKSEDIKEIFANIDRMLDLSFCTGKREMMKEKITDSFDDTSSVLISQVKKLSGKI